MRNRFAVNNAVVLGCMAEDAVKWLSQWFKNKRVLNIFGSSISTEMYSLIYFVRRQVFGRGQNKTATENDTRRKATAITNSQQSKFSVPFSLSASCLSVCFSLKFKLLFSNSVLFVWLYRFIQVSGTASPSGIIVLEWTTVCLYSNP